MRQHKLKITMGMLVFSMLLLATNNGTKYPKAKRITHEDNYHGTVVSDPYRWMEDVKSEEVQSWVDAQESFLEDHLKENAFRKPISNRIDQLGNTGKSYSTPLKRGNNYFFRISERSLRFSRYYRQQGKDEKLQLVYDPNEDLDEGYSPGGYSISPEGTFMAIKVSRPQAVYGDVKILNTKSGKFLPDNLSGLSNMALAWAKDETGFYYIDYGSTKELSDQSKEPTVEVKYHLLGDNHSADEVIFSNLDNPNMVYRLNMSPDFEHLVITVFEGTRAKNRVYIKDLSQKDSAVEPLLESNDNAYTYLGSEQDRFWFYTNNKAANGRVISLAKSKPQQNNWVEVVPESDQIIAGGSTAGGNAMAMAGNRLVLLYRDGPVSTIKVFSKEGLFERDLKLETGWLGSGLVGTWDANEIWFSLTTFTAPTEIYRYDLTTGEGGTYFELELPINKSDYVTKQIFYKSKDGTRVPMFIAHRKEIELDGSNPALIYGYGFGGWVATPWYQPHMLTWLDMGGVYAMPGIRGGGEYGNQWMEDGIRLNRQNAIDDYVAAAEWLVKQEYTSNKLLIANGWSASGSLAAAAVMQQPELYGAALIGIPSLDMFRYQYFTPFSGWTRGFGSSENAEEFAILKSYSPYHNIKEGFCYPPMLITVGEKDETTPPQHGYKFVAAMQFNQKCENPVMLKIVRGSGHSFGVTSEQTNQTFTDELSYLAEVLHLDAKSITAKLQQL